LINTLGRDAGSGDIHAMMADSEKKDQALSDLIDHIASDPDMSVILEALEKSKDDVKNLYNALIVSGAGQKVKGVWVAAAAIANPQTLIYSLHASDAPIPEGWTERDRWLRIAFTLVEYFDSRNRGKVNAGDWPELPSESRT